MEVGLLWYDDDARRGLEAKVRRAARHYREKYGRWPNTCYVHPRVGLAEVHREAGVMCGLEGAERRVRLLSAPNVLLHHFWLGERVFKAEDKPGRAAS